MPYPNNLYTYRTNNHMSQQSLAIEVGCDRKTISNIELEKNSPSIELAYRIANYLDAGLMDIFPPPSDLPEDGMHDESSKEEQHES